MKKQMKSANSISCSILLFLFLSLLVLLLFELSLKCPIVDCLNYFIIVNDEFIIKSTIETPDIIFIS